MSTATNELHGTLALPDAAANHTLSPSRSERLQKEHYEEIVPLYEAHYSDACSQKYREKFIYQPMFEGLDISGLKVLEAMCGSGQTTKYLRPKNALMTGLDISPKAIKAFQERWPDCAAVCTSALDSGLESNSFDCVVVVGGLHHMHPHVSQAIQEIHRVLRVGGFFCFMEPHSGSFPNLIRKQWYKHDRFFSDNEAAIDMDALKKEFSSCFKFRKEIYRGNIAFLLVLNSLIFRIPPRLKPIYTPALMSLESVFNKLQGKLLSCFVLSQWQKI